MAPVALLARHLAVLVAAAAVHAFVADAALEEPLAALAGNDAIVQACGTVAADEAGTQLSRIICQEKNANTHNKGVNIGSCKSLDSGFFFATPFTGKPVTSNILFLDNW